jgi:putative ABC transport system permease protein
MLKNIITNTLRNMRKHSGYLSLNIIGLTIGLASFMLITLYVLHELSYDRFNKNYKNTYRIKITGVMAGSTLDQAVSAAPMAEALRKDYPEVEKAVRVYRSGAWLVKYGDISFNEDAVLFADSTFFRVFDFRLLRGNPATALVNPRSIVLTEKYALKYFGKEDPLGKRISLEADTNLYTVTGVMENIPSNSHIKFEMLGSLNSLRNSKSQNWIGHSFYTYIVLKDGTTKSALEAKFPEVILKYVGPQIKQFLGITIEDFQKAGNQFGYVLEPLKDIHLKGAPQYPLEPSGSLTNVYIFGIIAFLILTIAIINYINLATAKSANRAREVGVRKVSGAHKSGLMMQFVGESVLIVSIAAVLALVIVIALNPLFSQLIGKEILLKMFSGSQVAAGLVLLILFVGTAAGFYPAFVLASYNPAEVLKGTMTPGSVSKTLRGILVVFQFSVSILIIIGAFVVYRQLDFMTSSDMGIDKNNLLVVRRPDVLGKKIDTFRDQLLNIPGVAISGNAQAIPGTLYSNNAFLRDDDPTKVTYLINQNAVSYNYAEALGARLVEGRFFSKEYGNDTLSIVLNEAAVKSLGLTDPIGKYILQPSGPGQFVKRQVIGVMQDFNIQSMHNKIPPVCFTFMPGNYEGYLCVRLKGQDMQGTIRQIEALWKDYTNRQPFQYSFFDEEFNNLYDTEFRAGKLFIVFSVLAIFIACLGLTGLIMYMTTIRTKEIGIRKTYGGTENSVIFLFSREVINLIVISSIVAYPIAFFGIRFWLETFAEKTKVTPLIYLLTSLIGLAIGWFSIMFHALRAARTNPAEALRYK